MQINLTEDIVPVTEFKKRMKDTFDQIHRTHRPVVLTVNGKADVVMMDAADFQKQQVEIQSAFRIMQAEKELSEGKGRPAKELVKELKRALRK